MKKTHPIIELREIIDAWRSQLEPRFIESLQTWMNNHVEVLSITNTMSPIFERGLPNVHFEAEHRRQLYKRFREEFAQKIIENAEIVEDKESFYRTLTAKVYLLKAAK